MALKLWNIFQYIDNVLAGANAIQDYHDDRDPAVLTQRMLEVIEETIREAGHGHKLSAVDTESLKMHITGVIRELDPVL